MVLKLMQDLNSPYIIKYNNVFVIKKNKLYIILKLEANNSLEKYIKTYMEMDQLISDSKIIKIGEFGVSTAKKKKRELNSLTIGTPQYMAPEMFTNQYIIRKLMCMLQDKYNNI